MRPNNFVGFAVTCLFYLAGSGIFGGSSAKKASPKPPGYGENCSSLTKCATSLYCTDGKCSCLNPEYQLFDNATVLCRTLVGIRCGTGNKTSCVKGAACKESKCTCGPGLAELPDGTCGVLHGQACKQSEDVCAHPSLACREGKCSCRNGDDAFNKNYGMCFKNLGYPCLGEFQCVANADCTYPPLKGFTMVAKKYCQCMTGYKPSKDKLSCVSTR